MFYWLFSNSLTSLWLWYLTPAAKVIQLFSQPGMVLFLAGPGLHFQAPCSLLHDTNESGPAAPQPGLLEPGWDQFSVQWEPGDSHSLSFACSWDSVKVRNCGNVPMFAVWMASAQQMKRILTLHSLRVNQNDWCDYIASSKSEFYRSIFAFCS